MIDLIDPSPRLLKPEGISSVGQTGPKYNNSKRDHTIVSPPLRVIGDQDRFEVKYIRYSP